ncbi:putative protein BRICK1-B [Orchesella cincta]|uniref:Protein BRICK1 n=1 Tax=Orchesella cincta TaxID=48709 RepID=A0A1D2MBC1_ORCCI|nr:putative protein BRICK1-B [Orchesella cincta]
MFVSSRAPPSSGSSTPSSVLVVTEDFQKQIQQDWANREYIEVITGSIKRICDFLNSFDLSCRSLLAMLNERLSSLEHKIEYLAQCRCGIRQMGVLTCNPPVMFYPTHRARNKKYMTRSMSGAKHHGGLHVKTPFVVCRSGTDLAAWISKGETLP